MAPNLQWLSTCKIAQLKALATAIGVNSSGTKPILIAALREHIPLPAFGNHGETQSGTKDGHHVISIDMGIRNLAYCRMVVPKRTPSVDRTSRKTKPYGPPTIYEWTRIAIFNDRRSVSAYNDVKSKEAFDPVTYARHAHDLVSSLLKHRPLNVATHILIERQRFRSMGGSSVQEWTLRVNMFEAMIYAVLKTFSEQLGWYGSVHPVMPAKVWKFWLGDAQNTLEQGSGPKSAKNKSAKINLVTQWLQLEDCRKRFRLEGQAADLGRAFLEKKRGRTRPSQKRVQLDDQGKDVDVSVETGKLDDLADCLLQGMAWTQWEENKQSILSKGIDSLHELER